MLSKSILFLLNASTVTVGGALGIAFACLAVGIIATVFVMVLLNKKKVGAAHNQASHILEDARNEAKTLRKEALIEAKEENQRLRAELDRETRERRSEMQRAESRVLQKEENLSKKELTLDKKIDAIDVQKKEVEAFEERVKQRDIESKKTQTTILSELERVSGLTIEEARNQLMAGLLETVKRDAGVMAKEIESNAKEDAEKKARNIIGLAIQKCAADHASELTVSVVQLLSDDMKGRLIGRMGRNIRSIENSTGVDLIIDDTPDVVTLSGFDPVRREIARITIERLISDGRIHPARIEEMVEKVKGEIDSQMKEFGETATFEAGVYGVHPELVRLLGRLHYRTSYGQNVLKHSLEVSYLAGMMASELGADVKIAKRAGLLHDIGKAVDHEIEGTHIQIGVELAKKYRESKEIIHAIAAHHGDIEATTLEAVLVQAADAISGARPGARKESIENYVKRLEKLESVANSFKGVEQSFAIQAGREIRVIVKPDEVDDSATIFMAKEIASRLESELEYPGQIKVNVIRELRSVEYAK